MQRVPNRPKSTPSQSNPIANCLLEEGKRNSLGSWDALFTMWIGTNAKKAMWSWYFPPIKQITVNIWLSKKQNQQNIDAIILYKSVREIKRL